MKLHAIFILLLSACSTVGGELTKFTKAESRGVRRPASIELVKGEQVVAKLADGGFLVLSLSSSSSIAGQGKSQEAAEIDWWIFDETGIRSGQERVFITYDVEIRPDGDHALTQTAGTEEFEKAGQKFEWSYGSPTKIFLYPPVGLEYVSVNRPNKSE